jgi:hypothetical protein
MIDKTDRNLVSKFNCDPVYGEIPVNDTGRFVTIFREVCHCILFEPAESSLYALVFNNPV